MTNSKEYMKAYRQTKLNQGWVVVNLMVPKELAEQIKQLRLAYKMKHSDKYIKM